MTSSCQNKGTAKSDGGLLVYPHTPHKKKKKDILDCQDVTGPLGPTPKAQTVGKPNATQVSSSSVAHPEHR